MYIWQWWRRLRRTTTTRIVDDNGGGGYVYFRVVSFSFLLYIAAFVVIKFTFKEIFVTKYRHFPSRHIWPSPEMCFEGNYKNLQIIFIAELKIFLKCGFFFVLAAVETSSSCLVVVYCRFTCFTKSYCISILFAWIAPLAELKDF